jgi:hypothetical protein
MRVVFFVYTPLHIGAIIETKGLVEPIMCFYHVIYENHAYNNCNCSSGVVVGGGRNGVHYWLVYSHSSRRSDYYDSHSPHPRRKSH